MDEIIEIIEMINILLTISDEGITFDSVEDCGNKILRRYKARHNAEQNSD